MRTNADLAAKLLRDAAAFFRVIAEQNDLVAMDMKDNADTFERADLVQKDPDGCLEKRKD